MPSDGKSSHGFWPGELKIAELALNNNHSPIYLGNGRSHAKFVLHFIKRI